jgi:hypothetical protein
MMSNCSIRRIIEKSSIVDVALVVANIAGGSNSLLLSPHIGIQATHLAVCVSSCNVAPLYLQRTAMLVSRAVHRPLSQRTSHAPGCSLRPARSSPSASPVLLSFSASCARRHLVALVRPLAACRREGIPRAARTGTAERQYHKQRAEPKTHHATDGSKAADRRSATRRKIRCLRRTSWADSEASCKRYSSLKEVSWSLTY